MSTAVTIGDPLIPLAEVAAFLNVDIRTARSLVTAGQLRAVRVGAQLRVEPTELRRFLDDNAVTTLAGDK